MGQEIDAREENPPSAISKNSLNSSKNLAGPMPTKSARHSALLLLFIVSFWFLFVFVFVFCRVWHAKMEPTLKSTR